MKTHIKNLSELSTTTERTHALQIVDAGLSVIDTKEAIKNNVILSSGNLIVSGKFFNLDEYKDIYVIGFGKASSSATAELENILGNKISGGIVIDKNPIACKFVDVHKGDHPNPTLNNVEIASEIMSLIKKIKEDDLVIVIVSGGGSSLLCYPKSEYEQGTKLYNLFLKTGAPIQELNTLRKHISGFKGGNLAKLLYPSTVISLIFSDVPGDMLDMVASGTTYKDNSTIDDAKAILIKHNITENFLFEETPKEDKYFEKVFNSAIVSNKQALSGMERKAKELGYKVKIISDEIYDNPQTVLDKMFSQIYPNTVLLAGGEPSMKVEGKPGIGGRNEYLSVIALNKIKKDQVFISFASDGIDNLSHASGGIIDLSMKEKLQNFDEELKNVLSQNSHDEFLQKNDAQIITGPTGSNVSDLMILLQK